MSSGFKTRRAWLALPALAAAVALVPAGTASASSSTICTTAGLPTSSHTISVPGVFHATVTTCDAAITPPFPGCNPFTIDEPGLLHVKVFVCVPGTTFNVSSSDVAVGADGVAGTSGGVG